MGKIEDKMWELWNEYSTIKDVLIISRRDFKREIERIDIQLSRGLKRGYKLGMEKTSLKHTCANEGGKDEV